MLLLNVCMLILNYFIYVDVDKMLVFPLHWTSKSTSIFF